MTLVTMTDPEPSVVLFEALALSPMIVFVPFADTVVVAVFDTAPALLWITSNTARLMLVPAVGFPSAAVPLGAETAVIDENV